MQLVVHFKKIRIEPPAECDVQSILRGNREPSILPVRMAWNEVNSTVLIPLMPRLCRADACVAFVGIPLWQLEARSMKCSELESKDILSRMVFYPSSGHRC